MRVRLFRDAGYDGSGAGYACLVRLLGAGTLLWVRLLGAGTLVRCACKVRLSGAGTLVRCACQVRVRLLGALVRCGYACLGCGWYISLVRLLGASAGTSLGL